MTLCYAVFLFIILTIGLLMNLNELFYIVFITIFLQMFYFQIKKLNIENNLNCLKIFKSNNFLGFLVFLSLLVGKI